jgi:transposase
MSYWARAPVPRDQLVLIATTLDDRIPNDHAVRMVAEILEGFDWSTWESRYHGKLGQPPIHPRILASLWLYGLRRGVRSSRKLEYMAGHNIGFMWLAAGHAPDHSTLSDFRKTFAKELKELFQHLARVAISVGFLTLVDLGTDGTRIKANNSRFETWTAARIAQALEELGAEFDQRLAESQETDRQEADGLGDHSLDQVPGDLADLKLRREKLEAIQKQLQEADAARRKDGIDPAKSPAQIPKHDPDSRVLPNKEGGFAPNYTPMVTSEGHFGYIVDACVIVGPNEHHELVPSIDRVAATFGEKPEHALADGAFATGSNIADFEARGIEFYSPIPQVAEKDNPALRSDPTQPVPETDWARLPISPQSKTLDKACFIYDSEQDAYYCPQGKPMPYEETKTRTRRGETEAWRSYRCRGCGGCPLATRCLASTNINGRTLRRDVHTAERERHAAKMALPEAQAIYDRRMAIAETPFAFIKHVLGFRQFLLRGLENVNTEWLWTCTAVNLGKLASDMKRLRARVEVAMANAPVN